MKILVAFCLALLFPLYAYAQRLGGIPVAVGHELRLNDGTASVPPVDSGLWLGRFTLNGTVWPAAIYSTYSSTTDSLYLISNTEPAAGAIGIVIDTGKNLTSGKVLSIRNNAAEKFSLDYAGNLALAGTVDGYDIGVTGPTWDSAYTHSTDVTGAVHGATAVNTASKIVRRDASGDFAAGSITGLAFYSSSSNPSTYGAYSYGQTITNTGNQIIGKFAPTYNQASGTATNTDFLINRTETAVGSGAQYLIDAQVGGTSKFNVTNVGNLTSSGTITSSGTFDVTGATGLVLGSVDVTGLTVTTDGTGTAEVALPAGAIDGTEILDNTIDFADMSDTLSLDASTSITADGTEVLTITNTGSGNSLVVEDSSPDTTPFVIDATGNVGIGDTTPDATLDIDTSATSGTVLGITSAGIQTTGDLVNWTADSLTTADVLDISAAGLTTGSGIKITGPSSGTAMTGNLLSLTSNLGSAGELINLSGTSTINANARGINLVLNHTSSGVTGGLYGYYIDLNDSSSTTSYPSAIYVDLDLTNNGTKTANGAFIDLATASTTADTLRGVSVITSATGILTVGTRNVYGIYSLPGSTAVSTGGIVNIYGGYFLPSGIVAEGGTLNSYGLYVANGTFSTAGTSKNIGLYVETPSGADTNYAAIFAGGNVGIGDASPSYLLTVGSGDLFGVDSSGYALLPVGAAATPSLSFTGDTNTGIYWSAANTIGFAGDDAWAATLSNALLNVSGRISAYNDSLRLHRATYFGIASSYAFTAAGASVSLAGQVASAVDVESVRVGANTELTHAGSKPVAVYNGTTRVAYIDKNGGVSSEGQIGTTNDALTLAAAAETFVATSNVMTITGHADGNTVATITGGVNGQLLTLICTNATMTITDTDVAAAGTIDLAGTATDFVSADDKTLTLVFDGTSFFEIARSVN